LYILRAEIFLSPKGYEKSDLTDRGDCCARDYVMEGGPTGAQQGPRQIHLVKSLQEQDVQGATSTDEDSVELDILDDGANYETIPPQLSYKVRVVTAVKGDGDLKLFKVLRGGG
jgi:hypothetical protein